MNTSDYNQTRSFNFGLAKETTIEAALVFDEISFWATKSKNGWIYKTLDELSERLPISARTIRRSLDKLVEAGYIEKQVKRANKVPIMHFRILKELRFGQIGQNGVAKMAKTETDEVVAKMDKTLTATNTATKKYKKADLESSFFFLVAKLGYSPDRVKFTDGRYAKLKKRLQTFTLAEIEAAAAAIAADAFMQGENDNKKKYGTIDYLLRTDEKLEEWRDKAPKNFKPTTIETVDDELQEEQQNVEYVIEQEEQKNKKWGFGDDEEEE